MTKQAIEAFGIDVAYAGAESPGLVSHLAGHELLMIAREALANSASHGAPSSITVSLSRKQQMWMLDIADNGKGFQNGASGLPHMHYGLTGMRDAPIASGRSSSSTAAQRPVRRSPFKSRRKTWDAPLP